MSTNVVPSFSRRILPVLALAGLLGVGPAIAQTDAVLREFRPTSEWLVSIGGKDAPKAELYESSVAGALLLISSNLDSPVLISRRTQTAEAVNLMKVSKRADGVIDLLADATLTRYGSIGFANGKVTFKAEGKSIELRDNPPLVGSHSRAELLAHSPSYLETAKSFNPSGELIEALKKQGKDVRVKVFFGSWCPHCRRFLPGMLKVQDMVEGSAIKFEYYGLKTPPDGFKDPEAVRLGVKGVPTGIIYVGDKEVGRIMNNDWYNPEQRMAQALGIPLPKPAAQGAKTAN